MHLKLDDIQSLAGEYTEKSPKNRVVELDNLKLFDSPLLAVADAVDPLFLQLKESNAVGPAHMSPREWMEEATSVISYFLPFSAKVREANRISGLPAKEWLYGRIEGEQFNRSLMDAIVKYLKEKGYQALAPSRDQRLSVVNRRSNWSERHVAFIAGLGTFSLNRSLITQSGSAGRIGSVICNLSLNQLPENIKRLMNTAQNAALVFHVARRLPSLKQGKIIRSAENTWIGF